jgi:radical SAM protein with 4Fe4S-binding SPASM domain
MTNSDELFVQETHLIYRLVGGETLLVNSITNKWYRLNQVGTQIFECLKQPATIKQLLDKLSDEFALDEVSPEELITDVRDFIQYLLQERVIRPEARPPAPKGSICVDDWRDELDAVGMELGIPTWAKIEISTACHLHCAHCYIPAPERSLKKELTVLRQEKELSDSEIFLVIDQLAEMGCLLLTLTGGEIFIKKTIFDILRHAHESGFVLELFTSATPLTPDKISALAELNVGRVQVSVYSHSPEIHDSFTGSPGSWERSVAAIRLMAESGLHVELVCSIVPDNYSDLMKIRELAESLGASCSYGYPITARTDGNFDTHSLRLNKEEMRRAIFSVPSFFAMPEPKAKTDRICPAAVNMCSVTSSGDVLPCSQFQLPAGNVRNSRLADIWHNSPVFSKLRGLNMGDLKGRDGEALPSYVGLCPGLNLLEEGDFLVPAAITVRTTKTVMEVIRDPTVAEEVHYRLTHPDETRMRSES